MAFYIVVHHSSDPNKLWANEWEARTLLHSITTPKDIAVRLGRPKLVVSVSTSTVAPGVLSLLRFVAPLWFLRCMISISQQPS